MIYQNKEIDFMIYQLKDIQLLVETGKIKSAQASHEPLLGGWTLTFTGTRKDEVFPLYAQRGEALRAFKGLDALQNVVKKLGLAEFTVKCF
ncbi:hypothetical protein XE88_p0004 (plasmid) [Vibrio parahaemolyticus]|nr:hypothetical protein XE88_p0004 [Vibrio parahaemolyticus]